MKVVRRNMGEYNQRIKCKHCGYNVKAKYNGSCPHCGAATSTVATMETLPETVSLFCRECHTWVSATKVKPLTNWFYRKKEYAAGLYQIQEHKRSGLLKLKCPASGKTYKQTIRLSEKRKLT